MGHRAGRFAGQVVAVWLIAYAPLAAQAPSLTILRAGPTGELSTLEQANEIRIVFSEPMVALGRITSPLELPFVRVEPAIAGTFRWSGTTILIFTPKQALPYATAYRITVEGGTRAVSGRQLAKPFTFTFTTPTVRLLALDHYRRNGRFDASEVLLLRFNQAVDPGSVLAHLSSRAEPHNWAAPVLPPSVGLARSDPATLAQFRAKIAAADAAARSSAAMALQLAREWDTKRWPASPDLVVVETAAAPPVETWLRLAIDSAVPSPQGGATPGIEQSRVMELAPAFFVRGFSCTRGCDPSTYNGLRLTTDVALDKIRSATSAAQLSGGRVSTVAPASGASTRED
jgi:hypothetical protein